MGHSCVILPYLVFVHDVRPGYVYFQVPANSSECVLKVEGLVPNQKYVFAVAAYNSQGKLLGNNIGETTFPLLASLPVPLLSTWAHLAQVLYASPNKYSTM